MPSFAWRTSKHSYGIKVEDAGSMDVSGGMISITVGGVYSVNGPLTLAENCAVRSDNTFPPTKLRPRDPVTGKVSGVPGKYCVITGPTRIDVPAVKGAFASWSSDDDPVRKEVVDGSFLVPIGTPGVRVFWEPCAGYLFDGDAVLAEYAFDESVPEEGSSVPESALPSVHAANPAASVGTSEGSLVPSDDGRFYRIATKAGVTSVTIANGRTWTFSVPRTVRTVRGVAPDQVRVHDGEIDLTGAYARTGDADAGVSLALDPNGSIELNGETITVRPQLAATDAEGREIRPIDLGADAVLTVRTIPGFTYSLDRDPSPGGKFETPIAETTADGSGRTAFTDPKPLAGQGFYRISVSE